MQFQFDIASQNAPLPAAPPQPGDVHGDLLRQLLDLQRDQLAQILHVQREHLALAKSMAQDNNARWRTLLGRWQKDLPYLLENCKQAYPTLEKIYVHLIASMVSEVTEKSEDELDNEFTVQEFIDRYGMRLGQLGHLVHVIGSLAEAGNQAESAPAANEG